MTKKEFLAGKLFKGFFSKHYNFKYVKGSSDIDKGYITIQGKGIYEGHEHYANIDKMDHNTVSIFFSGLFKIHRERLKFSELQLTEQQG